MIKDYLWATELCPVVLLLMILCIFTAGREYTAKAFPWEWTRWHNPNCKLLSVGISEWRLKSEDNYSKIHVAIREIHFIWLKERRKSQIYNAAYVVVSVPGFFLFGCSKAQCPSDQLFNISSHWVQADSGKRICRPMSADPSGMTFTSVSGLPGCSLSNTENRCCAIWIGLAAVKAFIWKSKHAENPYFDLPTG